MSGLRRLAYRRGWLASVSVGVPVVIVGNITAGGSGKTPLVIWLVNWLRAQGYRPGVVSRGYGGTARGCVDGAARQQPGGGGRRTAADPGQDRARRWWSGATGWRRRAPCWRAHPGVDVIVSDDGLQHYRLQRDLELAVIDAASGLGNGWPLPAGPLREPASRLGSVDAVIQVVRGAAPPRSDQPVAAWRADYTAGQAYRLRAPLGKEGAA